MTQVDPRVPKLEALLDRVRTRAAEPRMQTAPIASAAAMPKQAAAAPARITEEAPSVVRPAPHTISGPPPSRRSHGALPAVAPPARSPSQPAAAAAEVDLKTPIPAPPTAGLSSENTLSAVRIDVDPSVDALLAHEADYDDATLQANVEQPSRTLAGVGVTLPKAPSVTPIPKAITPVPQAPASAPRVIAAEAEAEEERHLTPPPESGKQKSPSLTPVAAAADRRDRVGAQLPRLSEDDASDDEGTLAGVGGGRNALAAKVTGSVVPVSPLGASPNVYTAALPQATLLAVVEGAGPAREPRSLGDLLDATLAL